ncbi:DUF6036 family nucleotidyltransferase [Paramaledivibacter caminithermalis]|uniref:DUF6036 domain-containing protein n=1 Tax=Paramaledivibacter caminithermalis (strain DSM 15212 / CIP 107654 / DViRD3) TaxID=1121301 RepID=A0A1M6QJJ5_PARC5|nr:DUF6036 family nucleotidyltransferase [Paramaledivibacter caminithermalis]SHK20464.1 hypothetical protein SAMN02745912_02606 [Paramaledivibacter caminithermalis DSM 15212]
MRIKKEVEERIYEMEKVAELFGIEPFDMYFLGGSACILGGYSDRATRDFDFIDLNYSAKLGKVFIHLRDFDMLEYESTLISPKYRERAIQLEQFRYLNIYILSIEDIIVSKIIRLQNKDLQDIDILIERADKILINQIINEVINRDDLFDSKKKGFIEKLELFRERYNV